MWWLNKGVRKWDGLSENIYYGALNYGEILLLLSFFIIWLLLQDGLIHQKLESLLRKLLILKLIKINRFSSELQY